MYHPSLSWEAIGVLGWAQTQPTFTFEKLLRKGTGRDRAYRILRELLNLGYLERIDHRDEKGRFLEYGYRAATNPHTENPEAAENAFRTVLAPHTENPDAAKRAPRKEQGPRDPSPLTETPDSAFALAATPHTENPDAIETAPQAAKEPLAVVPPAGFPQAVPLLKLKALKEEILTELKSSLNELVLENIKHLTDTGRSRANAQAPVKSKRDGVAELSRSLGLAGWQQNFARAAIKEERSRTAWFYLARNHPEVLKASYRLLDKTGERGPVTWATWLPQLAEDVRTFGADRVEAALEAAIMQAMPKGCWNYYRAKVEGRSRQTERGAQEKQGYEQGYGPYSSGYTLADLEREYGISHKGVSHV
jgi:hypothetical protein